MAKTRRISKHGRNSVKRGGKIPRTPEEIAKKKEKLITVINELKKQNQICSDFKIGEYFTTKEYYDNENCTEGPFATGKYILMGDNCIPFSSQPSVHIATRPTTYSVPLEGEGEGSVNVEETESFEIPFAEEEEAVGGKRKNRRGKSMHRKTMRGKIRRGKKTTQKGGVLGFSNKEKLKIYIEELKAAGEIKPDLTLDKVFTQNCDSYPVFEPPSFERENETKLNPLYSMDEGEENYPLAEEPESIYGNASHPDEPKWSERLGPKEDLYAIPVKSAVRLKWNPKGIRSQAHVDPGKTKGWTNTGGKRKTKRSGSKRKRSGSRSKRSGSKRRGPKTKRKRS